MNNMHKRKWLVGFAIILFFLVVFGGSGMYFGKIKNIVPNPDAVEIENKNNLSSQNCRTDKIAFDVEKIKEDGNYENYPGPLGYEFCLPTTGDYLQKIKMLDSSINCVQGSSGMIGCTKEEYLCLGSTKPRKDNKMTVCTISNMDVVQKIQQTFWE